MIGPRRPGCLDQPAAPAGREARRGEAVDAIAEGLRARIEAIDGRLAAAAELERERDGLVAELERLASGPGRP